MLEESPTPLYFQIKNIVKAKILSNALKEHERLPSEAEMCKAYNVSRGTLRQALAELIREGLVYRVRGKGSFVADGTGRRRLTFKGSIENLITSSREGRMKVLSYGKVMPSSHVAQILRLDKREMVFRLELVFSISKGACRCSHVFFPLPLGAAISQKELKETTEIILVVEEKLHAKIHHARQTMGVGLADKTIGKQLSVSEGTLLFTSEQFFAARNSTPIFLIVNYCRPDLYDFRIEFTRT
jgi:GntR family transcriptional regulator